MGPDNQRIPRACPGHTTPDQRGISRFKVLLRIEMKRAMERHDGGNARVVPVILRPVKWDITELGRLQALPKGGLPVTQWSDPDLAFVDICEGMLAIVIRWKNTSVAYASAPQNVLQSVRPADEPAKARKRVLDAALPTRVPIGKATVLVVLVRRPDSCGLRGILELDIGYGVGKEDVRSTKSFPIRFPKGPDGSLSSVELAIAVSAPDFELEVRSKSITIPPRGDSDTRVFLLTPLHTGELVIQVELLNDGSSIAQCLLRTNVVADDNVISSKQTLVSFPLEFTTNDEKPDIAVGKDLQVVVRPASPVLSVPEAAARDESVDDTGEVRIPPVAESARVEMSRAKIRPARLRNVLAVLILIAVSFVVYHGMLSPGGGTVNVHITSASETTQEAHLLAIEGKTSGPYNNIYVLVRALGASEYFVQSLSVPPSKNGSWQTIVNLDVAGAGPGYEVRAIATPDKLKEGFIVALPPIVLASDQVLVDKK
jgi:hypothetical protein